VRRYGRSALDYFKTYFDKYIFFGEGADAFVAYRVAHGYAVVLEDPICAGPEALPGIIKEFDAFCLRNGLRSVYYRVGQESLAVYESLGKKKLLIGQEAVVDLTAFTLEAKELKSVRNALRKVEKEGYRLKIYEAPLREGLLQKLASVSDEWLRDTGRKEIIFAQGLFDKHFVRETTVLAVENAEEKIVGFLNVIPDYAPGEGTYDLIRKTADAPNGIPDYLLVHLFIYLREKGCRSVNLGLVPLAGLEQAGNVPERTLQFASRNIKSFAHYKGLREYKNKFGPGWTNKYLVFTHDLDLLQLPVVLARISRP
jgi:phosphatidylglycerol lysyltransferase